MLNTDQSLCIAAVDLQHTSSKAVADEERRKKEIKKRMDLVFRKKENSLPKSNAKQQLVEYLVDDRLFIKHVMNIENINNQILENHLQFNLYRNLCHSAEAGNNNFLNIYIGVSKLDYPFKKIITNTLFRGNLIGVNHPFIIIGPYKIDWNDSSFVKIKFDLFRAASSMMVCKYETIRGKEKVNKALLTLSQACTHWNSYKKFSKLTCNCHHFIKDLLDRLGMESDFTKSHPTLAYMLDRLRLAKEERVVPWNCKSANVYSFIDQLAEQRIDWNQEKSEILIYNNSQLSLLNTLLNNHLNTLSEEEKLEESINLEQVKCCIQSYSNGYHLRNQIVKSIDYSQINLYDAQTFYNLELDYPLLNGFIQFDMKILM